MSKISLGQLDLLALQQYLEIAVGFRKKDDKAIDVQYVGDFEHATVNDTDSPIETERSQVLANQTAMAALDDLGTAIAYKIQNGEMVKDIDDEILARLMTFTNEEGAIAIPERQTVLNSLMLDGVPAKEFLKRVESDTILTDVNQATYNLSDDIRNIKDELYQLKNQLVKAGTIKDSVSYNGFIDAFLGNSPKNIDNTGVKVDRVENYSVFVESLGDLRVGEIIVLEDNGFYNIQRIEAINGNELMLYKPEDFAGSTIQPVAHQGSFIRKSLGKNMNGKFVFGCDPINGFVEVDQNKYIVKDGIERVKVFELDHMGHGFGTEIKIPASLKNNVISKVHVSLAVKGDPGMIKGEFFKIDPITGLPGDLDSPAAVTGTLSPIMASGWFNDFELNLATELVVQPGERYIFVLTSTTGGDAENKWYIGGFNDDECADEIHNDCYIRSLDMLYISPEDTDMFLVLTTKTLEETTFEKLRHGLYSCRFDVHQSLANRVRVELCINQEGQFKVKDNNIVSLAKSKADKIEIESRSPKVFNNAVFATGDNFVVGTQIGQVSSVGNNNSNVIPVNDVFVQSNADLYRVGYEVQVVASNKVLEPTMYGAIERYEDAKVFPLKFVGVVPGRDMVRPEQSSDRLLFECEFTDGDETKLMSFNHVEVQIRWFSNLDENILQANEELEGAIFDLVVSVDQAYTKSENEVE